MSSMIEGTIDEVLDHIDTSRKVSVLLGAGASVTGDIPLASGITSLAIQKFPYLSAKLGKKPTYAECMGELAPGSRQSLVREICVKAKVNWGHIALAQLVANRFVNRVLTTNFDPLVVRAC